MSGEIQEQYEWEWSSISDIEWVDARSADAHDTFAMSDNEEMALQDLALLVESFSDVRKDLEGAHEEYAALREKWWREVFSLETILENQLILSESERIKKLSEITDSLALDEEWKRALVEMLMSFHNAHEDAKIPPFWLKNHPDLIRTELSSLDAFAIEHNIDSKEIRSVYREWVDSGLLGSIEKLEVIEKNLKRLNKRMKRMDGAISFSIGSWIVYYLATHWLNEQSIIEILSPEKSFKSADLICKGILILWITAPSVVKFFQKLRKNNREEKKEELENHITNTSVIVDRLASHELVDGTAFINPFLGSFELIDELFSDEELASYAKKFAENSGNRTDINKLREAFAMEEVQIESNEEIEGAIWGLENIVANTDRKLKAEIIKRLWNMQWSKLYIVLHDIADNLDHIPEAEPFIKKLLSEIEILKKEEAPVKSMYAKLPMLLGMLS